MKKYKDSNASDSTKSIPVFARYLCETPEGYKVYVYDDGYTRVYIYYGTGSVSVVNK